MTQDIKENWLQADIQLDKAWSWITSVNTTLAHILQGTGELTLPHRARFISFNGNGEITCKWAVKARCKYGLRIEVLLAEDADDDIWSELGKDDDFMFDNLASLHLAIKK